MKDFKTGRRGRLQSDVPEGVYLEHGPGQRPDRWRERHCSEIFFVIGIVRCGDGLEVGEGEEEVIKNDQRFVSWGRWWGQQWEREWFLWERNYYFWHVGNSEIPKWNCQVGWS